MQQIKKLVLLLFLSALTQFLFCFSVVLNMKDGTAITGTLLSINSGNVYLDPEGAATLKLVYERDIETMFVNDLGVNISVPIVQSELPTQMKPLYYNSISPGVSKVSSSITSAQPTITYYPSPKSSNVIGFYALIGGNLGLDIQGSSDIDGIFEPYFYFSPVGIDYGLRLQAGYKGNFQIEYRNTSRSTSLVLSPEYTSDEESTGMSLASNQILFKIAPWGFNRNDLVTYFMYGIGSSDALKFNEIDHTGFGDGTVNTFGMEFSKIFPSSKNALIGNLGITMEYETITYKTLEAVDDYGYPMTAPLDTSIGTFRINFNAGFGFNFSQKAKH